MMDILLSGIAPAIGSVLMEKNRSIGNKQERER
jgi:hypothetical protein